MPSRSSKRLWLGSFYGAEYTLLRAVEPLQTAGHDEAGFAVSGFDAAMQKRLRSEAEAYLEQIAERLGSSSPQVQTRVVVSSQPAAAILDTARSDAIDLIALSTHGRGGMRRMVLGSVADKVLRGTRGSILICRPRDR